ncbi:hypothetical protein KSF_086980 [Reticulibacter mediterranei]|uniref:Uncharacterized protein n=2 Tax=Reticulibacter mediterranei TaxID=2778369 RepID=A0A8J3N7N0_9CHLR|nr:hypothetical protein KSF_086980 [Reticulibacter mediterranei]
MHRTFEEDQKRAATDGEVFDLFFAAMKHKSSSESDPPIAHRDKEEMNNGYGAPEAVD